MIRCDSSRHTCLTSAVITLGLFAAQVGTTAIRADDPAIAAALSRPILAPDQPLAEVQAFCTARVARLPRCATLAEWEAEAQRVRTAMLDQVIFRGAARDWRAAPLQVEWLETIPGGPGYTIQKLRYAALPGLWIPALLYVPDHLSGRVPVVLNVNGHDSQGKSAPYKQMRCINQARRGMLAMNVEWLGMGQLRGDNWLHYRANQLDLCGTSAVSVFYLAMQRGLDVLLAHPQADPSRVGMAGLSGGGWQTIFLSSLDERVTAANPVAGYSSFLTRAQFVSDLGDTEQTPSDMAAVADYTHLTALRAPRPTLLTFNSKDDCCFRADHALQPLLDATQPIFALYGQPQQLRWHVNDDPGTHNFLLDNRQQLYRLLLDAFFPNAPGSSTEIECEAEVKAAAELEVELPEENLDFHTLARQLAAGLPRTNAAGTANQRRQRLRELARYREETCQVEEAWHTNGETITILGQRLKIGDWSVPVVEFKPAEVQGTTLLIADGGRTTGAAEIARLLSEKQRVVAVDPFYFGESKISQRDFLYAMLVAGVGERPLGVQASQLAAVASWARSGDRAPALVAQGPRTSLIAQVAAACAPDRFAQVSTQDALGSLHQVIENNWSVDLFPELFCFGLLAEFDVPELLQLADPAR
ncbi:MAG: acetylxylan esterase [Pirellulales bacterium]|nr:acetylxylan esterase [Pirellulales bacterium]